MVNPGTAGLTVAYFFVALLLLCVNLYSSWRWPVKAAATIASAGFCLISWFSLPEMLGWPIAKEPPQKFRLHAVHIQQPDKLSKSKGAINLWVTDVQDMAQGGEPRAFQFPYTAPLHEIVLSATAKLTKGVPQMGEYKGIGGPHISGLDDPARAGQASTPLAFYDIPDPLFPDK